MQALILCGGLGTRLRSEVADRPKSMAPIRGKPFLEILLRALKARGVRDFVLATGHLSEQIENYCEGGACWDVRIRYSREPAPLGTGGAVKLAEPLLADSFLVLNGDTFVDFDPGALEAKAAETGAPLVMLLREVPDPERYGAVTVDGQGRVTAFREKGEKEGRLINAGVYLVRKEALALLPAGRPVSLEKEWMPRLLARGVHGVETRGLFIDIGVPEDFRRAQDLLAPHGKGEGGIHG
ncbi:MAG TPA: nucleotidyltransferase family protein [Fibrobacteria bacterium]|nr:nucleotidyltransferase family protein [Fibrobacteria bacterium]